MTEEELEGVLKSTDIPVWYGTACRAACKTPQNPPYIVYMLTETENFAADNAVYARSTDYRVELYTDKKGRKLRKKIEDALDEVGIYYDMYGTYIESEDVYLWAYEIQI